MAVHLYAANSSMTGRYFVDSDGELLFVPQLGALVLHTELGPLRVRPGEIAVVPRGIRFRVEVPDGPARGYLCENYGAAFTLPERGPIGANGLANERDFLAPTAAFEDRAATAQVVQKFGGNLWAADYDHSPLDVVAWHGNYVPVKYDTANFMVIGTVSFDHPDPSIYTVLTSPTEAPGLANVDFVIFPPRWLVGEDTFRPPWYHRNIMSEFMGLVHGVYDAKAEGFLPGGASLHNTFTSHGPDAETFARASSAELRPQKIDGTLAFMFESRWMMVPTRQAMRAAHRQAGYDAVWDGLTRSFPAHGAGPVDGATATPAAPGRRAAGLLEGSPPRFTDALPLWYQLAAGLRAAILGLDHGVPARLPTEAQLARHFGVSLTTVRQALASLAADGLITRHRRRGTFVNPDALRTRTLRVLGSADAVLAQQSSDEIQVLGRARVPAAPAPRPGWGRPREAVLIRRLRLDGGVPVSYAENYLRPEHAERISDEALARAPITKIFLNDLWLPLTRIDNAVSARTAPAGLAALLRVDAFGPVLVSENVTYAAGTTPVDVARIHYRGDRFTFAISLDIP